MVDVIDIILRWGPLAVQALLFWAWWSFGQKFVSRKECERCRTDIEGKRNVRGEQIVGIEKTLAGLPARTDIADLKDEVSALSREVGEVKSRLNGVGRAVDLMNQYLLKGREE